MSYEDIEKAKAAISRLYRCRDRNASRIEVALDSLASALLPLAPEADQGADLDEVMRALGLSRELRDDLEQIYEELTNKLESKGYGDEEEDEEDEDVLESLIADLCDTLNHFIELTEGKISE